jgi:hypothetical protein
MNTNLSTVQDFCEATGMRLNIKKSACFSLVPAGKSTYTVNTNKEKLNINGEAISLIGPDESLKYLGSKMSPWKTKVTKDILPLLEQMLKNLRTAKTQLPSHTGQIPTSCPQTNRPGSEAIR